jgi:hypothetical protein
MVTSSSTIEELQEELAKLDELTLLELLDITSEELVYYLNDIIVEKQDELRRQFEEEDEED